MKPDWRSNWVLFYSYHDDSQPKAYELLKAEGVYPYEVGIHNGMRSLLLAMGVDNLTTSQVFHGTKYVGTVDELQTYIYTLKRIYGEKL